MYGRLSSIVVGTLAVLLVMWQPTPSHGQQGARRLFTIGADDQVVLPNVRAAAAGPRTAVVLSTPTPALHARHADGTVREWGGAGDGPGEFRDPIDLHWSSGGGLVLDQSAHRLTAYASDGRLLWARSTGSSWANRIRVVDGDTLLQEFEPMGTRRAVVRLRGTARDTVLAYDVGGERIRLTPAAGPSLTVVAPFHDTTQWTDVPGAGLAVWLPGASHVEIRDLRGEVRQRLPVPSDRIAVGAADREWWFADAIPASFRGQRAFDGVRAEARRTVAFPSHFVSITAMLGDPAGGVWVRRTSPGSGEIWQRLASAGSGGRTLRLPAGRELLALGDGVALARALSADGEPIVEGWELP